MAVTAIRATNANWVASALSIAILLLRSIVTRRAQHVTLLSKYLCVISIAVVMARIPVAYNLIKSSNIVADLERTGANNALLRQHAVSAGGLALAARCLATTYFWLQIILLLRFYSRVVDHIQWVRKAINITWALIISTYVACILATFLECRPIQGYWQSDPKPACARAYVQIFLQGGLNIVLDIMLLIIAIPLMTRGRLSKAQLLQASILMLIGTFCIVVTGVKLAFVTGANSHQPARTFWASIQVLVSTFVANAATIYGCLRLRKKQHAPQRQSFYPSKELSQSQTKGAPEDSEVDLTTVELKSFKSTQDRTSHIEERLETRSWPSD